MNDFLTALALVFVIEGALYALFPVGMRKSIAAILEMPDQVIRLIGLFAALIGVFAVWLIRG